MPLLQMPALSKKEDLRQHAQWFEEAHNHQRPCERLLLIHLTAVEKLIVPADLPISSCAWSQFRRKSFDERPDEWTVQMAEAACPCHDN